MLPQKIFKIRIFNLAESDFQTTKFPDVSLTFGILSQIPWLFRQIPWLSEVSFKFPDLSRSVVTLIKSNIELDVTNLGFHIQILATEKPTIRPFSVLFRILIQLSWNLVQELD